MNDASRLLREWRIGWSQGALMRAVRVLDRIDPGWQQRPRTLQMLGLIEPGPCTVTWSCEGFRPSSCKLAHGHAGAHKDPDGMVWWLTGDTIPTTPGGDPAVQS